MDRRTKATLNRDKAVRLNEAWGVGAAQVRYSDDGHWYATLERFPAALFDAHGYVLFQTEKEYRSSRHLHIGKQISIPKPGISAIPGYVRVADFRRDSRPRRGYSLSRRHRGAPPTGLAPPARTEPNRRPQQEEAGSVARLRGLRVLFRPRIR